MSFTLDGSGEIGQIVGGYNDVQDYLAYKAELNKQFDVKPKAKEKSVVVAKPKNKLSYKDQTELAALPDKMAELEQQISEVQEKINSADFFEQTEADTKAVLAKLEKIRS